MNQKIKLYRCRGYLFCNYELLKLSITIIAKKCDVAKSTIWVWLRKFNIRIRTISEAKKGKNHPNYGKTGEKHPNYGKHWFWSEESKDKMRGENNPTWKGDDVKNINKEAIHNRIRKVKPKPKVCDICHQEADKEGRTKLVLSNIKDHNYTLNPDDYQWIHQYSCHLGYDWTPKRKKEYGIEMKTIRLLKKEKRN
ncbi:hypothetical protein LCGC14_1261250 [marine sediment metagenome]|uniref:Nuclease associated modular domain-containing protein n=1 Tax=marine sediment metagenome TaxID=412755 RepID=A0A0F9L327_9ZZZZ